MSRTLRTAFTTLTIALALTACGSSQNEDAAPTADVPVTEAPATTAPEAPAPEAPTTEAPVVEDAADEDTADEADATPSAPKAPALVPAAAPAAEPTRCSNAQGADGGQYMVSGIAADDADGGLVVRAFAGTSYEARGVLPNFTAVDTYLDNPEWASCMIATDGSVWWEIAHQDFATGGWVSAYYLEPLADDHVDQPEEEADAHADCVIFFGDEQCVVAYFVGDEITFVEPLTAEASSELHLACVYNGNDRACDVLAFVGSGDGIGNALTQTPTEFLVDDCANLTGIDQALACAELATRS